MKSILISIKPRHCANILNGHKKIEVRTTTTKEWKNYLSGKTDVLPEPIECLIYCTKQTARYYIKNKIYNSMINGKIIAKFTLKKVERILPFIVRETKLGSAYELTEEKIMMCQKAQLTYDEYNAYLKCKVGYAWYIDDLEIFKLPKELSEFEHYNLTEKSYRRFPYCDFNLTKAPQSWCYVESEKNL